MIHVLGMNTCNILLTKLQLQQTFEFNLISILIFDSILAVIVTRYIESPISKILKRNFSV